MSELNEIVFNVTAEENGGYSAAAVGSYIFTQGDTWEELRSNVQEAIESHYFEDARNKPQGVRLLLVRDERLLVA